MFSDNKYGCSQDLSTHQSVINTSSFSQSVVNKKKKHLPEHYMAVQNAQNKQMLAKINSVLICASRVVFCPFAYRHFRKLSISTSALDHYTILSCSQSNIFVESQKVFLVLHTLHFFNSNFIFAESSLLFFATLYNTEGRKCSSDHQYSNSGD